MLNKVDVLLVYEHVSRELESLFILRAELEKKGLSVAITPIHFDRYFGLITYRPKVLVLPFLYSESNKTLKQYREVYDPNLICLNLHHEQFYNDDTKHHMLPKDEYSKNVYHLSWSEKFKRDLVCEGVDSNLVKVIGNPRCDSFYMPTMEVLEDLKKKYSKVIFIPTTFSWAFVDEEYFLSTDSIDPDEFRKTRKITLDAAKAYFSEFYEAAINNPDFLFVLRPHPFEDVDYFRSKFLEFSGANSTPDNILISREYNVYNWLKIADYTVGWCTTVNIESVMAGVPSIVYHPTYYPKKMDLEFYKYFEIVKDKKDLSRIISDVMPYKVNDDVQEYLKDTFGFNGTYVSKSLSYWIFDIVKDASNEPFSSIKFSYFGKYFLKSLYIDLVKSLAIKTGVLGKVIPRYSGLIEDYLPRSEIEFKYKEFLGFYYGK
ncbi:hypothetical protein [Shewanella algae]|uniref:hypothetical protein n=1 Tax=Shewanella algae TaxID=38313 RepID=UPI0030067773